ncbi:hypothetical protein N657DRAFT_623705 [Parathielavia appendiculata]|uniref:DNA replication checkpoint mediator MRC1 domain-containing protein n=1 Tax=Parathielavia appendiculata TaxID=2587402 RepID=A0AAN6Z1B2_9PEZI|nr:hypothetical protein N657DRAFT_623705 [Parathielavia appendiculata]
MASSRSPSPSLRRSRSVSPTTATTRLIQQSKQSLFAAFSDSDSEEDSDILRPRGKMAARMQARDSETPESESEVDDDVKTTRATPPRESTEDIHSAAGQENMDDDNDEDVVATRPRKLHSRRERSFTPKTRPQKEAASAQGLFASPQKDAPESPGLFVSPSKPQSPSAEQSDDDLPSPTALTKNPSFRALVAKKRQERLAKEAAEGRKKAERRKQACFNEGDVMVDDDEDDNITDDEGGRKLTQEAGAARPPRKASKKALEEMNRETQRLTRSLQLGYEAKVRKKITKATLFERFNFKPENAPAPAAKAAPAPAPSSSRAPTPGSPPHSDAEMKDAETPPSSPPAYSTEKKSEDVAPQAAETTMLDDDDDFPTLEEIVQAGKKLDKGKCKATVADLEERPTASPPRKRNFRLKLPPLQVNPATTLSLDDDDDDDDLQIVPTRKSKLDALFDRIPLNQAKESRPLQVLRRLAHLDDPDKKAAPPSNHKLMAKQQHNQNTTAATVMTAAQLQASLLQRARQQVKLERDRQLEMLRAKGIHVQTAEERERELQDVDDIVAKARQEAEEIMEREREAAKAERKRRRLEGGGDEEDAVGWDDDSEDDEEYVEEEEGEKELELSGSEEEEEVGEDGEGDGATEGLIDDAAESAEESETEDAEEQPEKEDSDEELPSSKHVRRRPKKKVTIVSDDEDEAEPLVKATPRPKAHFPKSPSVRNAESPAVPTSVLRSATKPFIPGLPVAGPAGLGLTQIFAGTMDDSQTGLTQASPSQPRPTFDVTTFPDSNFSQTAQEAPEDMILDSQRPQGTQQGETQGVQIRFSQSQMQGFDTLLQEPENLTQASELIEPTQDAGFHNFSPLRQRFVEPPVSTADTVPVGQIQAEEQSESPLVKRTGKLRRKAEVVPASPTRRRVSEDGDETKEDHETDEFDVGTVSNNVFAAMKEAALKEKKRKEAFDKKKSKARDMVEEQAEESEDEYAGLGGADGEDSDDEDDQSVKGMIDDETRENEEDERRLAAFYADRERAADEQRVEKLFHDITTGALRRKRQGNWDDLSDSDDGGEARRRMKRRQFAKMQRALFADERISKVAENPRSQAFLRTIEDRGSDEEMDFIFAPPPPPAGSESQESQASAAGQPPAVIPNSQPQTRPAANPRRNKDGKKPAHIGEIRESLSNLLDEPFHTSSSLIPATELGSSDDDEEDPAPRPGSSHSSSSRSSNKENRNPRRSTSISTSSKPIIDRITLKRNSSSASSNSNINNKLAFTSVTSATASSSSSAFKVPALLRRATTNSLLSTSPSSTSTSASTSSSSSTGATIKLGGGSGGSDNMKIKKPAGKRSGVSYLARETERRAAVAEAERRREAKKLRGVEGRVKAVGGLFAGGRFE